jgi:hypothetical protein
MPLVAVTILLSAFLLFLVQPIIAKQILPWFGGTSAVWTTCLVFFQVLLLGGYAYSHVITQRLDPKRQAALHIALLIASLAFLPIVPREWLKPAGGDDAALRIIVLLAATIGLPYFLLSTTGPLLQKWIAHRFPDKTVYRLFALSNFGSLIGLLAFPFAIEPYASSLTQSYVWSFAYGLFCVTCAVSAWQARTRPVPGEEETLTPDPSPMPGPTSHITNIDSGTGEGSKAVVADAPRSFDRRPTLFDYALWLTLSALGSVVLLASTSHMTQNIASVPFLWVLPLTLYLLSFVLAFEGRRGRGWYDTRWGLLPMLLFAVAMAAGLSVSRGVLDIALAVVLYSGGTFFACWFCHGELAQRKPAPRYLTNFYLTLSLGGAIGGLLVGVAAPRLFDAYYELPLALFALCALALIAIWTHRTLARPSAIGLGSTALVATVACAYYGWSYVDFLRNDVIFMHRNFYGTLRVREQGSGERQVRRLLHGVILHGEQPTLGPDRLEPGTYYGRSSGVAVAIAAKQQRGPVRLGFVGLGVGTLSAYGRAGDTVRFYELDPDVLLLARTYFTYLDSSAARIEFVLGDARLSMERELREPQRYDVLAIDAFSSDSIPVHLITREAMALYRRHIAPDGIIAVHISNRFLDLRPVLANIAQESGLAVRLIADNPGDDSALAMSDWVLLARDERVFADAALAARVETIAPRPEFLLWTDQFNNLLDVLKADPLEALRSLWAGE